MKKLLLFILPLLLFSACSKFSNKIYYVEIDKNQRNELLGDDFKTETEEIEAASLNEAYRKAYTSFMISKEVSEGTKSKDLDSQILRFRLLDENKKDITHLVSLKSRDSIELIVNKQTSGIGNKLKKQLNDNYESNRANLKIDSALAKKYSSLIKKEKDEFSDTEYFLQKNMPKSRHSNFLGFYATGSNKRPNSLHFLIQYTANDWLFIESIVMNIDGVNYNFVPTKEETYVGSGFVAEWTDDSVNLGDDFVQAFIKAKSVKYRLNGKQFYKDYNLSSAQIQAGQNLLNYFSAFN